jgi:hypothetical protein
MNGNMQSVILALILGGFLGVMPAAAQAVDSAYTRHDYEKCRVITEEEGAQERVCEGHAGIPVHWLNGPDSSTVYFGDEAADDTYDARFAFAVVQSTIEWRGPRRDGRIEPFAAIVRFQLCQSVSGPCRPELVIFRLDGRRRSCIAATVNARLADANVRARALADTFVQNFRCGQDSRRPPE